MGLFFSGSAAPTAGLGNDGDHYVDTTAKRLYGPKAAGAWGSGTDLTRTSGKTVKAMADSDQTLSADEAAMDLIKTTGTLMASRKLTLPTPATEADSLQRTILNACVDGSILVGVGSGNRVEIEPGAKAIVEFTPTGARPVVDLVLDPRDFGCPWNGVDDDLPGLQAMLASIPRGNNRSTKIQLPKGPGYCSDNLDITRKVEIVGHGMSYGSTFDQTKLSNAIIFPPLKGVIFHGDFTAPEYPLVSNSNDSKIRNLNVVSLQAIVSDSLGNWGHAMHHLSTTLDTWTQLPANVVKGTCVIRSDTTVGSSPLEYYGDGHTRNTTHLVMFRCTTPGTKGASEPAGFATAGLAQLGTTIAANGGTAAWTVESIPKDYTNNTAYVVGERVVLPGDNNHVFECIEAGTSVGLASTTIAAGSDGQSLLQLTINVADTSEFPPTGIIHVETSTGRQFVSYTGKTGTSFTGCSNVPAFKPSSGTMSTGGAVTGPFPFVFPGIPVRCAGHFPAPPHRIEFYDTRAVIAAGSNGQVLPQATINVDATSGFAASGTLRIWTGTAYTTVTYTGKTDTTFTGCSSGAGTLTTGNEVGQGVLWREIHGGGITILANWISVEDVAIFGFIGAAVWITGNFKLEFAGGSNFWKIKNSLWSSCGEGLVINSNNCNGGESAYCQQLFMGAGHTNVDESAYLNINGGVWANGRYGNAGHAIKDRVLGNNNHRVHYNQFSGGMPYRNDLLGGFGGGNFTHWIYLAHEVELQPIFFSPAIVEGAVHGVHGDSTALILGNESRNIVARLPMVTNPAKSLISIHGPRSEGVSGVFRFRHSDDGYPVDWHISDELSHWTPKWWVFGKGENPGWFTEQVIAFPRPGANATLPGGGSLGGLTPLWICQDYAFFGTDPSVLPTALGFSSVLPTGPYGQYYPRGTFLFNRGADTRILGWVCETSGAPGTWQAIYRPKHGETDPIAMGDANVTLTAEQNLKRTIVLTGTITADRTVFLAVPATNDEGAEHAIDVSGVTGVLLNVVVNVVGSPGTTVTIATGKTAIVRTNPGGVKRQTADV